MARTDRALIAGGGLAGLIAARRLALAGAQVTVLEASDRFGGQLAQHHVGGIPLDAGAEAFATRGGTVEQLATALGLAGDIVRPADTPAWLYRADGSAVPLPATSLLGIPGTPLAADVVAAIGSRAAWRAQLDALMLGQVGARARTLGELVRRRMGRGVLEGLVAPVVRGVHSADPDDLELDVVAPGLRRALLREASLSAAVRSLRDPATAGSQVAGLRGGVARLVDVLLQDLEAFGVELRTGARVESADPGGVTLAGGERLAGHVLVAHGEEVAHRVTLVTLVVDVPGLDVAPRGTGVLVAAGAGVGVRALTHVTAKWDWVREAAEGRHVLRLSYDAADAPDVAAAVRDAVTLLGVPVPHPDDAAVVTWERAAPRMHAVDGMQYLGEAVAGTGIAAVVAQADAVTIAEPE